jgi:hypothetical protein
MADFLFGDSANYAPDEFTVEGTKYRRADLPTIVNQHTYLLPLISQAKPVDSPTMSIFPTTNPVTITPDTVRVNGHTYRKIK